MIGHHTLALLLASVLLAQPKDDAPKVYKSQARALLDPAADMVSAVTPELHGALLRDLGMLYVQLDKKKAAKLLDDGFRAALAVPDPERSRQQGAIVKEMTALDVGKALELLGQLPPHAGESKIKPEAYERVVSSLIDQGQLDRAVEALNSYGAGEYPYKAAASLMDRLDANDGRRLTLFGAATAAYQATPRGDFGGMITRTYKSLPRETVQAALGVIVNALLETKKEDKGAITFTSIATDRGSAGFGSDQELELFKIFKVLDSIDPKRAAEVLEKRPALRDALAKMPDGMADGKGTVSRAASSGDDPAGHEIARKMAAEMDLANRVRAAAAKNPREGIDLAARLEDLNLRGQVLAHIAGLTAEKDPKTAEAALTKAIEVLDKMDKPLQSSMATLELLGAAEEAKLPEMTERILEKGFALVERLAREDRDAKSPNTSPRDVWPSTQVARMMMNAAGHLKGPDAIPLLERWKDPELRLVAQVALARSLLGLEIHDLSMSISH